MDIMGNSNHLGDTVDRDIQAFSSHRQMSLRSYSATSLRCLSSNSISLQKNVSGGGTITWCKRPPFLFFFFQGWFLTSDGVRVEVVIK